MAVSAVVGIISAVGAGIAYGFSAAVVMTGFAVGAGLSALSKALAPKVDLGAQIRGTTVTTRDAAGSRKIVYGRMRVGGNVVFIHHAGADNKYLYLVVAFATHEIESYEEIWFNDNKIWENGSFVSDWETYVTIDRKYGTATQGASTALVNDVTAWTNDHKLSGIAYISFRLEWDQDKFPQGVPNITSVIKGKKVYDPRLDSTVSYGSGSHRSNDESTWEYSANSALCTRDYLVDEKYGLGEDASTIDLTVIKTAADLCDELIADASQKIVPNTMVNGTFYEIVELGTFDYTAVGASSNTVGVRFTASNVGSVFGSGYVTAVFHKRYECNGRLETANQIKSNIEQILGSMGGRVIYSGGKYHIQGAEYRAPTFSFDESQIISSIKTQTKQSRRSLYNSVKGTFVSAEKDFKVLDYPAQILKTAAGSFITGTKYRILFVGDTDFTAIGAAANEVGVEFTATGAGTGTGTASKSIVEDGAKINLDMPLPFVSNNIQAQRLAKIALLRSRQQVVISMTVNLSGLRCKVGDVINIDYDKLGYSAKTFEIIGYQLTVSQSGEIGVQLDCIETASSVYDWSTADEEDFLSGGELDLYDGRTVNDVTGFTLTEDSLLGPDGTLKSSVILDWTAPDDAFVDFYKIRYNENGTTTYFHVETKETNLTIQNLDRSGGKTYDFRIQVQNLLGVSSSGVTLSNQSLGGDTTAPDPVTNVSIESGLKYTATVTWTNPTNADFAYVQIYTDSSGVTKPVSPIAKVNGTEYVYVPRSKAEYSTRRYFWLEAVDFSGNVSTTVGPVNEVILVPKSDEIDGDVSEIASVGIVTFPAHTVTSSATTFGEFTVPAPEDGVKKYGSLSGNLKYQVDSSVDTCLLVLDVQRESKGVTSGTEIGAIVASGTITQYYYYVEVSGNHVKEIDGYGGIATTQTSPSTIEKPLSVEYQVATDRTRVIYTSLTQSITTGTLYYNPDRWTSSGSYLSDGAGPYRPMIPTLGASTTVTMPVNLPLAKSDDDETYRVRVNHLLKSSGTLGLNQLTAQVFLIA